MLNTTRRVACRTYPCILPCSYFSSTPKRYSLQNPPLNLDPGLQALLRDVDISLKNSKKCLPKPKELEIVTGVDSSLLHGLSLTEWSSMEVDADLGDVERESRKSPAAIFGSNQIGSVILPQELQSAVEAIISASQKSLLRSDAKRLFLAESEEGGWDAHYDTVYRTRNQAARHAIRDGTAFASVALPAHYSAVAAVLHHVRQRLGPSWNVDRVIDWGAGTGSGLWASLYSFQENAGGEHEPHAMTSSIKSYLAIDKREGLVGIGKRLVNHISAKNVDVRWQKSFREEDKLLQEDAEKTVALSAFMLTTLPTPIAQKALVEEMWASGAHTIILIDHDTTEGFKAVAHAREHVLEMSRLETGDSEITSGGPTGCHVLAPCPHDRACPLFRSGGTPLICGFSQRLQRPTFLRRTKHSGVGHEDIHFSYVVLQRGPRPELVNTSVGRIGGIGRRLLDKAKHDLPLKELEVHDEGKPISTVPISQQLPAVSPEVFEMAGSELQAQLRKEAYQWPRLVFPPLKKSGHIILDACTADGKIMRMTIPKSQGKQPYYDARKSSWGDIFPHPPKNAPQERHQTISQKNSESAPSGDDIGKRKELHRRRERASYPDLAGSLKERKKLSKMDYARIRHAKVWHEMSNQ